MTSQLTQGDNIGIMDPAFFVSKNEILSWINTFFQLKVQKVEQCATGAVYCQIIDAIYPGTVQMSKVNWVAKHDYEFAGNYRVLQTAFQKNGIARYVDPTKLMKAKYQDNLEMLQWIKRYFDLNYNGSPYDASAKRKGAQLYLIGGGNNMGPGLGPVSDSSHEKQPLPRPTTAQKTPLGSSTAGFGMKKTSIGNGLMSGASGSTAEEQMIVSLKQQLQQQSQDYEAKIAKLSEENNQVQVKLLACTSEKEYYYTKMSELNQFLADQQEAHEVAQNPVLQEYLQRIYSLVFQQENSDISSIHSKQTHIVNTQNAEDQPME